MKKYMEKHMEWVVKDINGGIDFPLEDCIIRGWDSRDANSSLHNIRGKSILELLEACKQALCILSGRDRQYLDKALEYNSDPEAPYHFLADVINKAEKNPQ